MSTQKGSLVLDRYLDMMDGTGAPKLEWSSLQFSAATLVSANLGLLLRRLLLCGA